MRVMSDEAVLNEDIFGATLDGHSVVSIGDGESIQRNVLSADIKPVSVEWEPSVRECIQYDVIDGNVFAGNLHIPVIPGSGKRR